MGHGRAGEFSDSPSFTGRPLVESGLNVASARIPESAAASGLPRSPGPSEATASSRSPTNTNVFLTERKSAHVGGNEKQKLSVMLQACLNFLVVSDGPEWGQSTWAACWRAGFLAGSLLGAGTGSLLERPEAIRICVLFRLRLDYFSWEGGLVSCPWV